LQEPGALNHLLPRRRLTPHLLGKFTGCIADRREIAMMMVVRTLHLVLNQCSTG